MSKSLTKVMTGLIVAVVFSLAGCGGGGGSGSDSSSVNKNTLKGTWIEQGTATQVEGTIVFGDEVVTRTDRSGTYTLNNSILTYNLNKWEPGLLNPIDGRWLGYTNIVTIAFDATGTVMTWKSTQGTWTPQFYPVTFKKQ